MTDKKVSMTDALTKARNRYRELAHARLNELRKNSEQIQREISELEVVVGDETAIISKPRAGVVTTRSKTSAIKKAADAAATKPGSLQDHITQSLGTHKAGLTLTEMEEAVKDQGYVSTSSNFSNMLYQCLNKMGLKQHKDTKKYRLK